jgi:hypothetical protein
MFPREAKGLPAVMLDNHGPRPPEDGNPPVKPGAPTVAGGGGGNGIRGVWG